MKLKKKKNSQEKSLTLVLLMVCQFAACYKKQRKKITIINGSKIEIFGEYKERLEWLLFCWVDYIIYGIGYVENYLWHRICRNTSTIM